MNSWIYCQSTTPEARIYNDEKVVSSKRTSLVAQMVKNLPAMWETQVWSLGREEPLEKEMVNIINIITTFWPLCLSSESGKDGERRVCQCRNPFIA